MGFQSEYGQLFRYLGSKRKYVERVLAHFVPTEVEHYSEPFLGSGSVFTFLAKRGYFDSRDASLSDGDPLIAGVFTALETRPYDVLTEFLKLRRNWDKSTQAASLEVLDRARKDFKRSSSPRVAATTYAVRSSAVHALLAERKDGRLRASFREDLSGDYYSGRLIYFADLLAKVKLSGGMSINHAFVQDLTPTPKTFAFLDPPYASEYTGYYNSYISSGADKLQEATADYAKETARLDGAYIACNSTALAKSLYGPLAHIVEVAVERNSGKKAAEILVAEYSNQTKSQLDYVSPVLDGTFGPVVDPGWSFFDEVAPLSALQRSELYGFTQEQEDRWSTHFADEQERRRAAVSLQLGPNSRRL